MSIVEKNRSSRVASPRRRTAEPGLTVHVKRLPAPETPSHEVETFGAHVDPIVYRVGKRAFDVVVAGSALVGALPVMGVLALIIKAEDRGPVFYKQFRVGRHGRLIPFYKFRSMRVDADAVRHELLADSDTVGAAFKMKKDPRVTRIGRIMRKLSFDELPQLVSVLKGDMTVVGPRPHLCEEVATYDERQRHRLSVKPGLLCLREIRGRSELDFQKWVELDLEYIENRSLGQDLKICLLAVPAIVLGKGAY